MILQTSVSFFSHLDIKPNFIMNNIALALWQQYS